uniref:Uncharacterized protein n=1 Tax=Rhizophora mucronata TaxID=61149 RepID=A0A2P2NR66_RHIMU
MSYTYKHVAVALVGTAAVEPQKRKSQHQIHQN